MALHMACRALDGKDYPPSTLVTDRETRGAGFSLLLLETKSSLGAAPFSLLSEIRGALGVALSFSRRCIVAK